MRFCVEMKDCIAAKIESPLRRLHPSTLGARNAVHQRACLTMNWTRHAGIAQAAANENFARMTRPQTCTVNPGDAGSIPRPHPSRFKGDDSSQRLPP